MNLSESRFPEVTSTYCFLTAAEVASLYLVSEKEWLDMVRKGHADAPIALQRCGEAPLWCIEQLGTPSFIEELAGAAAEIYEIEDPAPLLIEIADRLSKHASELAAWESPLCKASDTGDGGRAEAYKQLIEHRREDEECRRWAEEWFDDLDGRYGRNEPPYIPWFVSDCGPLPWVASDCGPLPPISTSSERSKDSIAMLKRLGLGDIDE